MANFDEVKNWKEAISNSFLTPTADFHAVGVGRRITTNEWCLRIYVSPAKSNKISDIRAFFKADVNSNTIPFEIILTPRATFSSNTSFTCIKDINCSRQSLQTALVGGISSNCKSTDKKGTLGCLVKRVKKNKTEIFALSCNHVYANNDFVGFAMENNNDDSDSDVERITQPSSTTAEIATLENVVKLIIFENGVNYMDAAIAKLDDKLERKYKNEILHIGQVKGILSENLLQNNPSFLLCKHGMTTAYTEGTIFDFELDVLFDYLDDTREVANQTNDTSVTLKFKNQLFIVPTKKFDRFAYFGDSGSLVVTIPENLPRQVPTVKAVGLLFAIDSYENKDSISTNSAASNNKDENSPDAIIENYALASPIKRVLNKLKVQLL